jgi:Fur family zinc uptake transcriptional regulator
MLDFLQERKLVHKLVTSNQYLPCSHITCDHAHSVPQFLICDACDAVEEVSLRKELMLELQNSVSKIGFSLESPQLELHGRCRRCQS